VSVIVLTPSAIVASAIICACMSVAKPGYGEVDKASGFRPPFELTLMPLSWNSMIRPACASALSVAFISSGRAPICGCVSTSTVSPWIADPTGGRTGPKVYVAESFAGACADVTTPALTLADPGEGPQLTFWTKHDLEYDPTGEIFGTEGSLGQVEVAIGPSFSSWSRVPREPGSS